MLADVVDLWKQAGRSNALDASAREAASMSQKYQLNANGPEQRATLRDLVHDVCGPLADDEAIDLLWAASSYPFGDTESIHQTLSDSWNSGGKTVSGAISYMEKSLGTEMKKIIGPTYYVRHPDDSYSIAEPQPSPLSVWEDASIALPAIDTPVWAYEDGLIFFSVRVDDGENGWAWARIYFVPGHSDKGWEMDDSPELDAEYKPTHWQHLPEPPK